MKCNRTDFEKAVRFMELTESNLAGEKLVFDLQDLKDIAFGLVAIERLKKQNRLKDFAEWAVINHEDLMVKSYERRK